MRKSSRCYVGYLFVCVLVVSFVSLNSVVFVRADDALLIHGYGWENYGGYDLYAVQTHPTSSGGYYSAIGQGVMFNATYQLGLFQIYGHIEFTQDCNATVVAQVYNNTDNLLLEIPSTDGAYIAQSFNTYEMEDFTSDSSVGWWNFYFDNITMVAGNYTFAVVCNYAGYPVGSTALHVGVDNTSPTDAGQFVVYYSSGWSVPLGSKDMIHNVYTFADASATPTPTPSSTPTPPAGLSDSALNELLGQLFWWLAVLIIVLGPAFVLGVIFKGGTMGFAVGLMAGAGLGYWLMRSLVPLWVVVGVVLCAVAMIWSKMGRSN